MLFSSACRKGLTTGQTLLVDGAHGPAVPARTREDGHPEKKPLT
ncbi:MAG: hypothetical protein R2843_05935 [Thermomicrobiales bacterium]